MKILYKNSKVEKQFNSFYSKSWKYPNDVGKRIKTMENFLATAESLQDVVLYPPYRTHRLLGDRKNEWSLSVGATGYRVTFVPCDDEGNEIIDGDIINKCKTIRIVKITEVSKHYE